MIPTPLHEQTNALLMAYREMVKKHIKEALMKDIEPIVEKAAQDAVDDLKSAILVRYHDLCNKTVIEIELKYQGPKP